MNNRYPHVRAALFSVPWLLYDPQDKWARLFCDIVDGFDAKDKAVYTPRTPKYDEDGGKLAYTTTDGVATIDLIGPIFPRANLFTQVSGATSAEEFRNNLSAAMDDDDVESVLLRVDSPGGAVSGIFEAADAVYSARRTKDIVTLAEGTMASAAYLIGSQASAVYATTASVVGSIGAVLQIEDDTRQKENDGIKVRTIKTGPLKAIGTGTVTDEQETELRAMVDDFFSRFKGAVQRSRMGVDIDAVSTGAVWIGRKAEDMGLIDGISSMDGMIKSLSAGRSLNDLLNR